MKIKQTEDDINRTKKKVQLSQDQLDRQTSQLRAKRQQFQSFQKNHDDVLHKVGFCN